MSNKDDDDKPYYDIPTEPPGVDRRFWHAVINGLILVIGIVVVLWVIWTVG